MPPIQVSCLHRRANCASKDYDRKWGAVCAHGVQDSVMLTQCKPSALLMSVAWQGRTIGLLDKDLAHVDLLDQSSGVLKVCNCAVDTAAMCSTCSELFCRHLIKWSLKTIQ